MNERVLVTGAAGFLGRHLVRELLDRGYTVRALVRSARALEGTFGPNDRLEECVGDITQPEQVAEAVAGCAFVIHAAALASVHPARSDAHWQINLGGTQQVVKAAVQAGVRRLVYVGTANVFGFGPLHHPGDETHPYQGYRYGLDYMDSKRAATDWVLSQAWSGLPVVLVHPTFMLGPSLGARLTSGAMLAELAAGKIPAYPPGGKNYVHVADVAAATVNALKLGRTGESYILGNRNLSYRDAFRLMAAGLGTSPPPLPVPRPLMRFYGWWSERWARLTGQPGRLNPSMARVACDGHYFTCEKAVAELKMPQTSIEKAIEDALTESRP